MKDKLKLLIDYIQSDGRVCPMPIFWNDFWEILPEHKRKENGSWNPSAPLILAAWWDTTAEQKQERLIYHIKYGDSHGVLEKVDNFLRKLKPNQWAYGDGTTTWKEWRAKED